MPQSANIDQDALLLHAKAGETQGELAKRFGVSKNTIGNWLRRLKFDKRDVVRGDVAKESQEYEKMKIWHQTEVQNLFATSRKHKELYEKLFVKGEGTLADFQKWEDLKIKLIERAKKLYGFHEPGNQGTGQVINVNILDRLNKAMVKTTDGYTAEQAKAIAAAPRSISRQTS